MKKLFPTFAVIVLLLSACSESNRSALRQADALIEEFADSALTILHTIDRSNISNIDLPYYALLVTQAQVKTDIPIDSDSLISIAYQKYSNAWQGDKGIRSSFYMGEIFFNQSRPREAMLYYLRSYEKSKQLSNDYWRAKSAERIADLFFNSYNYPEAARYRKEAIEYFGKSGRRSNQRYAIADLASDYINDSRYEEAITILDSIYDISVVECADTQLCDYIARTRLDALAFLGRLNELDEDHTGIPENPKYNKDIIDIGILKLRFPELMTDSDSKTEIISTIINEASTDEDKTLAYYALYRYSVSNNKTGIDLKIVDSLIHYQNAVAQKIILESVTAAERDFYLASSERNHRRMILTLIVTLFITLITGGVIFAIWRLYKLKEKASKAELDANIEALIALKAKAENLETVFNSESSRLGKEVHDYKTQISVLKDELNNEREYRINVCDQMKQQSQEYRKQISEIREKQEVKEEQQKTVLATLFKEKWSTLSMLCEEYYAKGTSPTTKETIQKKIETEVKAIGTAEGLLLIQETTDNYLDGLISKLKKECPKLKDKDIQFCSLIFAGFSVRAMSFILNTNPNNIYVRKKRIIERITSSDSANNKLFIKHLQG